MNLRDLDDVQTGDTVYVTYDNLNHVPAIVRRVMQRKEGTLSIRIRPSDIPKKIRGDWRTIYGWVPLVVTAGEWELKRNKLTR